MTTIELQSPDTIADRRSLLGALRRFFATMKQRRQERRAIVHLSQLDARLLRDIGLEPHDVEDALNHRRYSLLFAPARRPYDHE